MVEGERQIARSDRQFALTLTDEQYAAVMAVVERWRTRRQPSYNLSRRNCVHFVAEIAEASGLRVDYPPPADEAPALLSAAYPRPQSAARADPAGRSAGRARLGSRHFAIGEVA